MSFTCESFSQKKVLNGFLIQSYSGKLVIGHQTPLIYQDETRQWFATTVAKLIFLNINQWTHFCQFDNIFDLIFYYLFNVRNELIHFQGNTLSKGSGLIIIFVLFSEIRCSSLNCLVMVIFVRWKISCHVFLNWKHANLDENYGNLFCLKNIDSWRRITFKKILV